MASEAHSLRSQLVHSYSHSFSLSWAWVVLCGLLAMWVNFRTPLNIDSGWLLYAAKRVLAGERLYVDVLETNPPLIVWLFLPPAAVASWLQVSAVPIFYAYVLLCSAVSLILVWQELKRHPFFDAPRFGNILLAVLAQTLLAFSVHVFGQREHFFIILILPYLVQSLLLPQEPRWNSRQVLIILAAGIGFCIKPFFLLILLAGEAWNAYAQRNLRLLWRRTNLVIGAVAAVYALTVVTLTPEYLSFTVPRMMETYSAYHSELFSMAMPLLALVFIYMLPAVLIMAQDSTSRHLLGQTFCLTLAAALTVVLQHKGWLNHFYPLMFMGALQAACVVIWVTRSWSAKNNLSLSAFTALMTSALLLLLVPVYELAGTYTSQQRYVPFVAQLSDYIARYAKGKNVYGLSPRLSANFSALHYTQGHFPYRFGHLWMLPGVLKAKAEGREGDIVIAEAFTLHAVTEDFLKHPPVLVWVDNNNTIDSRMPLHFDLLAFFQQDKRFAELWKHYEKIGVLEESLGKGTETYTVYVSRRSGESAEP